MLFSLSLFLLPTRIIDDIFISADITGKITVVVALRESSYLAIVERRAADFFEDILIVSSTFIYQVWP